MTMVTADKFIAHHIDEHRSRFNQGCHLVGHTGMMAGVLTAMLRAGHRFVGLELLLTGFGLTVVGHIVERNLARAFRDFLKHPVWTVRGDLTVIRELFRRSR